MAEEKTRVDFNAPRSLVERADSVVDVLDISRTRLLIDALEDELEDLTQDETFRRRVSTAYYEDRISSDTVEKILGYEEAMRLRLLRESLDRMPAIPELADDLPTDEEFYAGEVTEWTESDSSDPSDEESRA